MSARPAPVKPGSQWWFLDVHVTELSAADEPTVVAEAVLPHGAAPPFHVHADLDDSFYVLEGTMVVRCGGDVTIAGPGTWVPFPRGVPHTFRVMSPRARVLLVHAHRGFMDAVHDMGDPAGDGRPHSAGGPAPEALNRMMAEHGMRTVGPAMEQDEATRWLQRLGWTGRTVARPASDAAQGRDRSRP